MSDTKKMAYHITITNNETGKTLHDSDACGIMASINEGDGTADCMFTDCGFTEFVDTLTGICRLEKKITEEHPGLLAAARALVAVPREKITEETETKNEE